MAPGTDFTQTYQRAISAYMRGTYEEAANLTDQLVEDHPHDPNLRLLRGHIYCCLWAYNNAQDQYQEVLKLTADPELIECAQTSLADVERFRREEGTGGPETASLIETPPAQGRDRQTSAGEDGVQLPETQPLNSAASGELSPLPDSEPEPDFFDPFSQASGTPDADPSVESIDDPLLAELARDLYQESPGETAPSTSKPFPEWSGLQPESDLSDSGEAVIQFTSVEADSLESFMNPPGDDAEAEQAGQPATFPEALAPAASASTQPLEAGYSELDFLDDLGDATVYERPGIGQEDSPEAMTAVTARGSQTTNLVKPATETTSRFIPVDLTRHPLALSASGGRRSQRISPWMLAAAGGVASALAVAAVVQFTPRWLTPVEDAAIARLPITGLAALVAGLGTGLTAWGIRQQTARHFQQRTSRLQDQMNALAQGGWSSAHTLSLPPGEQGSLTESFNQMIQVLDQVTQEAQQRATEQEAAREALQRQVIQLLDEVEGAAQGDLTVQADVTADVLGAVADSFNLTIHNLRKIVHQVKVAAEQVNTGAAENQAFATSLSADALRQAEELAATLNSVQLLTQSIHQVAASAREADEVARSASATAHQGGESVKHTVAGILKIRETVAESTRKVKRLAESSQEISKIVALISQIASRTNLLALNASIEAARAGETGRGFGVVADEIRQLADRAAKSSKEIEQIVLQIQSDTSAVMTAMEEGTQQVIEGTHLAEAAKRSLDDIIQVSGHIDTLVSSITTATVEQTQTSQTVAQVMQAVELTAQETSQESQRVSDSLRQLVSVAQELQTSVERFKVE